MLRLVRQRLAMLVLVLLSKFHNVLNVPRPTW